MIPSTYRSSHGPWNWRILLLRPKFFMCKDVWIQWVQQKKLSIQQPYWRKFLTCKWNLSFFIRDQTENNMQLFHKILVLHVHTWFYIPNELQLHNKYVPNLEDHQILTHLHNRSSESNWAFFGKIWSLKIDKIVRITFKKDLSCSVFVCFQYLTTLCKS